MLVARSYECPACGGLVREAARVCNYCQTPIATIRCSNCLTMNVPEAQHCMSCGAELGLEPINVEQALGIRYDIDPSTALILNEEQVLLNGARANVCPDSGRWCLAS